MSKSSRKHLVQKLDSLSDKELNQLLNKVTRYSRGWMTIIEVRNNRHKLKQLLLKD